MTREEMIDLIAAEVVKFRAKVNNEAAEWLLQSKGRWKKYRKPHHGKFILASTALRLATVADPKYVDPNKREWWAAMEDWLEMVK